MGGNRKTWPWWVALLAFPAFMVGSAIGIWGMGAGHRWALLLFVWVVTMVLIGCIVMLARQKRSRS